MPLHRSSWRRVPLCVLALLVTALAARPRMQSSEATIIYPPDGTTAADFSQPIQWTSVPNVLAYYLYVGTTPGAKDLVNTGEIPQTSYLASNLPADRILYARMWTKSSSGWQYVDSSFSATSVQSSKIAFPADGTVGANLYNPFLWTRVANVQAYYLYVGTSVGAKDLVNTGETQQTSYLAPGLPTGVTLYARMWTKAGGTWRYIDSTFTAAPTAPLTAALTYPSNGAINVDVTQPLQWTSVANAQAYYLYVGSTAGAKDLVDTGETLHTSYSAAALPSGRTLYARLWTKVAGVWRYVDTTFTAAPSVPRVSTLIYPPDGAANADMSAPIQWTTIAGAQTYYLYVGSAPGADDLINTGETLRTSYLASNLPAGRTLYVRIWTKYAGVWLYVDSTFTAAPSIPTAATLLYPANGSTDADPLLSAQWNAIPDADTYYLYVGTVPGAKDVIDSYETTQTTYPLTRLRPNQPLFARLWTKQDGTWRYTDSSFVAAPLAPAFIYPTDGASTVSNLQPFRWQPPSQAQKHQLLVGTTPGGNDVFDSGIITATSVSVPTLPTVDTLYARVLSYASGVWRHSDVAFSPGSPSVTSTIVVPADGETGFDTARAFQWTPIAVARSYRLTIGTTPGASDLHDSGDIHITHHIVPNLPYGTLFGTLQTNVNGATSSSAFTFTVVANTASTSSYLREALWVTDQVRRMATTDDRPLAWTELYASISPRFISVCSDFADTLLQQLVELNLPLQARRLDVALNPNTYDAHTLVEVFDPSASQWVLLDPTFDLTVTGVPVSPRPRRPLTTADNVSSATHALDWSTLGYRFLGPLGDSFARHYYLDYPLLFNNVYHVGDVAMPGVGAPVLPYFEEVPLPVSDVHQVYAVGCSGSTDLVIDGVLTTVRCDGVDQLSHVFDASTIAQPAGAAPDPTVQIYRPLRFVF